MKVIQTRDYGTHKHSEDFTLTDYFCPHCGEKTIWEGSQPDYYQGVDYICRSCGGGFEHPHDPRLVMESHKVTWSEETEQ